MSNIDFLDFIKLSFKAVFPGSRYINNWHIKVLADRLQAAFYGRITRLIINMPPRSMKSMCVSVAWPAWILGINPQAKIIVASYSQILSERLSLDTRFIVQSEWYRKLFPNVLLSRDQNTKSKFQTTERGYRFATSVGGTLTGEGGNFLIVDDPISPMQAMSKTYRDKACMWFDQTFMTRLNDRRKGVVIVVMHRLHVEDLTGYLLSKVNSKWHNLSLPIIGENRKIFYSLVNPWLIKSKKRFKNVIHVRKVGELLYRSNNLKYIEELKIDLGSYAFASQYQQNPLLLSKGIVKYEWFKRHKFCFEDLSSFCIVQSWDTAISVNRDSDFTVCTTWGQMENNFYLLEVYREKLEYPSLKKQVLRLANSWKPHAVLVEAKASGLQLIQELKLDSMLPIIKIIPAVDKLSRFYCIVPIIESGRVFLPYNASWLSDFEQEVLMFPNACHDDQVDSMTQYLQWIYTKSMDNLQIRSL